MKDPRPSDPKLDPVPDSRLWAYAQSTEYCTESQSIYRDVMSMAREILKHRTDARQASEYEAMLRRVERAVREGRL